MTSSKMPSPDDTDITRRNAPPEDATAEMTVSELSQKIKRCLEQGFDEIRLRAELGRVYRSPTGHIYLDLKDDKAVLSGVIWSRQTQALTFKPEVGLEVVCVGRLGTFQPQSKYQIVIESMQPAGEGALMAMLEKRRKKLAAAGLFAEERKQPLPYLPQIIGVVTSPGGAVIHDILHRLSHRFPRHVLLWPVRVQGEGCAEEVVAAIRGFNALTPGGDIPRPDLIIVARGGGSLEDLWPFNEESIVHAVAESDIPLISAIGHESDTTLIDYAADRRAPTPSAAAEMSVPVRADLLADLAETARRLRHAMERRLETASERLRDSERHIRRSTDILALLSQRFDIAEQRLSRAFDQAQRHRAQRFNDLAARVAPHALRSLLFRAQEQLGNISTRIHRAAQNLLQKRREQFVSRGELLEAFSHQRVLERGFVLVWSGAELVQRATDAHPGMDIELEFAAEQRVGASITGAQSLQPRPRSRTKKTSKPVAGQTNLFGADDSENKKP